VIRKAKKTNTEIASIFSLIADAAKQGKVLPRSYEEIEKAIEGFFVAEKDDIIIGCCALEIYSPKLAELRSLSVHSDHQGNRIGVKLVEACLQEAKRKNIFEVLAITDKDIFFEKLGFQKCLNGQWAMFVKL
jgi:amino-acid N-acetyltransferase